MGKLKKGCLGVVGIMVLLALVGGCAGDGGKDSKTASNGSSQQAQQKTYADVNINTLLSEAKENAAKANQKYKDKSVKIIGGHIDNIDSDVNYVSIGGAGADYTLIHIRCSVKKSDKSLKDEILELKKGQNVTVYGTITEVGDIMGYSLKLDKIEPVQ